MNVIMVIRRKEVNVSKKIGYQMVPKKLMNLLNNNKQCAIQMVSIQLARATERFQEINVLEASI
jgi:hypothetical protein